MAEFLLDFGAKIDILTKGELDESLSAAAEVWAQRARGIRYVRRTAQPQANSWLLRGPAQGYAWDVKLIGAQLSAADSIQVFLTEAGIYPVWGGTPANAGTGVTVDVARWSAHQVILNPGESLTVKAVTAGTNITDLVVSAVEVPAERIGVILS